MESQNLPVEIDADLIRSLRLNGQSWQATKILKNYYKNKKKNKIQLEKELDSQKNKKLRIIKQTYGLCRVAMCPEKVFVGRCCKYHYHQRKSYEYKRGIRNSDT